MTSSAIKQIRDLKKSKEELERKAQQGSASSHYRPPSAKLDETKPMKPILKGLAKSIVTEIFSHAPKKPQHTDGIFDLDFTQAGSYLSDNESLRNSFVALFITPQVALRSDIGDASEVVVGAYHAQLKVFDVIDRDCAEDEIKSLIRHSSYGSVSGVQSFCPRSRSKVDDAALPARGYVPIEVLLNPSLSPLVFDRLMAPVNARLRYDKWNQLRIAQTSSDNDSSTETAHDRISAQVRRLAINATPKHYQAIFNVVTNLILYNDPAQSLRSKELQQLLLVEDFSDLDAVGDRVGAQQDRVRQEDERLQAMHEQMRGGNAEPIQRYALIAQRAVRVRELRMLMQAVTTKQTSGEISKRSAGAGLQIGAQAEEVEWEMLTVDKQTLAQLIITEIDFAWRSRQDSSVSNEIRVGDLVAINPKGEAAFAEIIGKLDETPDGPLPADKPFLVFLWNDIAPVGGISVVEKFELNIHPIRLSIEHHVGQQLLEYVFSQLDRTSLGKSPKKGDKRSNGSSGGQYSETSSAADPHGNISPTKARNGNRPYLNGSGTASSASVASVGSTSFYNPSRHSGSDRIASSSAASDRFVSSSANSMKRRSIADLRASAFSDNTDNLDPVEMQFRRNNFHAFVYAVVPMTVISLSYKVRSPAFVERKADVWEGGSWQQALRRLRLAATHTEL